MLYALFSLVLGLSLPLVIIVFRITGYYPERGDSVVHDGNRGPDGDNRLDNRL